MGYLAVAIGGAAGAAARYGLSGWVQSLSGSACPLGTLLVNVIGSLLIGAIMQLGMERIVFSVEARLLWTTGFCGGLTTFSTFSYETLELLGDSEWLAAGGNLAANVAACLLATYAGMAAARLL